MISLTVNIRIAELNSVQIGDFITGLGQDCGDIFQRIGRPFVAAQQLLNRQ